MNCSLRLLGLLFLHLPAPARPLPEGDGVGAVPLADGVYCALQPLLPGVQNRRGEQVLLLVGLPLVRQRQGGDVEEPDGRGGTPHPVHQLHGRVQQLPHQMGAVGQVLLPGEAAELGILQPHLHRAAVEPLLPQPPGHAVAQQGDALADLLPGGKVLPEGAAVAHALHRLPLVLRADGGGVQTVGEIPQLAAQLSQQMLRQSGIHRGQLPDSEHAVLLQSPLGGGACVEQTAGRQGPDDLPPALRGDEGGGVGLLVVAAQLGEHLVEADPHRQRQPQLLPDSGADAVSDGGAVPAEQVHAPGDVQPALVDAEGLHQVGVLSIDLVDEPGELLVALAVGRQENQIRALLPRLPDGLRRLHAAALGRLVFSQDDALAAGGVAADRHRPLPQLRVGEKLHRGVKAVEIAVQDDPFHSPLRSKKCGMLFSQHTTLLFV